jgi:predicted 3-demethylubiquinone-9 3-methyltransferase (glyoxalase superfamily)
MATQKLSTCLWFDNNAEDAVNFYVSLFPDSRIVATSRNGDTGPGPKGSVLVIEFEMLGRRFMALNGGPVFTFNESVSLVINCDTQREIDDYWERLSADGGKTSQCGWLKDKFGLSWQVIPSGMAELMQYPARTERVMRVVMQMQKIDLAKIRQAAA